MTTFGFHRLDHVSTWSEAWTNGVMFAIVSGLLAGLLSYFILGAYCSHRYDNAPDRQSAERIEKQWDKWHNRIPVIAAVVPALAVLALVTPLNAGPIAHSRVAYDAALRANADAIAQTYHVDRVDADCTTPAFTASDCRYTLTRGGKIVAIAQGNKVPGRDDLGYLTDTTTKDALRPFEG